MNAFPDTSFLCALYRPQVNSSEAQKHYAAMKEPLCVSGLVLYEFRQSMRYQIWLNDLNPQKGIPANEGEQALVDLDSNLFSRAVVTVPVEWADVHRIAEQLSVRHTKANGHRALDILHVATALHLEAKEFLTFDERQRKLALAEGIKVRL